MAYRVLPTGEPEVILVNLGSTYWMRVSAHLRARVVFMLVLAALMVFVALPVAGLAATLRDAPFWGWLAVIASSFAVAAIAIVVAIAMLASLRPLPHEALLPRRLVCREGSIDVHTADGELPNQRWSYVVEAVETAAALVLVLRRDPPLRLVLAKSRLAPLEREVLTRWLRQHGCLRA